MNPISQRPSTDASVGHSGYMSSPQDPGRPQPHGTSGGKAGSLRGVRQKGKPKDDPIGDPSSPRTKFLHQTPAQKLLEEATLAYLKNGTDSEKEEVAYYAAMVYNLTHNLPVN